MPQRWSHLSVRLLYMLLAGKHPHGHADVEVDTYAHEGFDVAAITVGVRFNALQSNAQCLGYKIYV